MGGHNSKVKVRIECSKYLALGSHDSACWLDRCIGRTEGIDGIAWDEGDECVCGDAIRIPIETVAHAPSAAESTIVGGRNYVSSC